MLPSSTLCCHDDFFTGAASCSISAQDAYGATSLDQDWDRRDMVLFTAASNMAMVLEPAYSGMDWGGLAEVEASVG